VSFQAIETFPQETHIRHYGGTGIVVGRTTMSFGGNGSTFAARSRYTHVFRAGSGGWQLVSAQGTPIPDVP